MTYFYPYFGDKEYFGIVRFGGPGLGNLLFPYFRAFIYCSKFKGELVEPTWPTLKIGPLIRNELDTRFYFGLFKGSLQNRFNSYVKLRRYREIQETEFLISPPEYNENTIVLISGLRNYFKDLQGFEVKILKHLLSIASTTVHEKLSRYSKEVIGIHIRLGDYSEESRISLDWYERKILELRAIDQYSDLPVIIFSDGKDSELEQLLLLKNVSRVPEPDALSDILRLSQSKVIIGSNSTFSGWAGFLSQSPFVRPDNFYLGRLRSNSKLFEGESLQVETL